MNNARDGFPLPYEPQPHHASWVVRVGWRFSALGRARLARWRAFQAPGEAAHAERFGECVAPLWAAAERDVEEFQAARAELTADFVACALSRGLRSAAAEWVGRLAGTETGVALRWQLMGGCANSGDDSGYAAQAKALLQDPLATMESLGAAVLQTVATLYERHSGGACQNVLESANPSLQKSPQIRAALALCQCPSVFRTKQEAQKGAASAQPEHLGFSNRMCADALLAQARACEWVGDHDRMKATAEEAVTADPGHEAARYWAARSRLWRLGGEPEELPVAEGPDSGAWGRLKGLVRAWREPCLAQAEGLAPVLTDAGLRNDPMERQLALALVQHALTEEPPATLAQVETAANVAQAALECDDRAAWAHAYLALRDIRIRRDGSRAKGRLAAKGARDNALAKDLWQAAALLAGDWDGEADGALAPIGAAASSLLAKPSKRTPALEELARTLAEQHGQAVLHLLPELESTHQILRFAVEVLSGGAAEARNHLASFRPDAGTPGWAVWILVRTKHLAAPPGDASFALAGTDVTSPSQAWLAEGWAANHWRPLPADNPELAAARAALDQAAAGLKGPNRDNVARLRQARAAFYRSFEGSLPDDAGLPPFPDLAGPARNVFTLETKAEMLYAQARRLLAQGKPLDSLAAHKRLRKELAKACPLTKAWWGPIIRYWSAAAQARQGEKGLAAAKKSFRGLYGTFMGLQARAQAALVEIAEGEPDKALALLDGLPSDLPAACYAKGLAASRKGDDAETLRMLDSAEGREALKCTPYDAAARRLLAALAERVNRSEEAESRSRDILEASPKDEVASLRLARVLLVRHFDADGDDSVIRAAVPLATQGRRAAPWADDYLLLGELASAGQDEIGGLLRRVRAKLGNGEAAWGRLALRRLLSVGRAEEAWRLAKDADNMDDAAFQQTQDALQAWHALRGLWRPLSLPDSAEVEALADRLRESQGQPENRAFEFEEMAESELLEDAARLSISQDALSEAEALAGRLRERGAPVLGFWQGLLEKAIAFGAEQQGYPATLEGPEDETHEGMGPLAPVACLWHSDPEKRGQAAQAILTALRDEPALWDPLRRDMLKALAARALGDDAAYLEAFRGLEPHLDALPFDARHVWLGAAEAHFHQRNWKAIAEAEMPTCLEDLSLPKARLLVGFACAQAAASEKRISRGLELANTARELLAPFLAARNGQGG